MREERLFLLTMHQVDIEAEEEHQCSQDHAQEERLPDRGSLGGQKN